MQFAKCSTFSLKLAPMPISNFALCQRSFKLPPQIHFCYVQQELSYILVIHSRFYTLLCFCSMDAIGAVYKKSTKQCTLEKRRNLLAELLCRETKEFEVCPLYYFVYWSFEFKSYDKKVFLDSI